MPGEFTIGETTLGDTLPAIAGPPSSSNLGASALIDRQDIKARWGERYTSDAVNKKFVGFPRGIYYGFVPVVNNLRLTLKPDLSVYFTDLSGAPQLGETITGSLSGATAVIRVISSGFFLIDTLFDTFEVGETITGGTSGFTAEVTNTADDGISFARVTSSTPTTPGLTEHMIDVLTTDTVSIDFSGFVDGNYFVYVTGSYSIGSTTIASVQSRTTPPPDGITEVLICTVEKLNQTMTVAATAPVSRQEPFAQQGQRIGFMPAGSIEGLLAATATTDEVIAARESVDGTVSPTFDVGDPQNTGLPDRLRRDLSREAMASRLGKRMTVVRGNDLAVAAPITAGTRINVSGSFSARTRDFEPVKDITNEDIPAGVPVPIAIEPNGSDNISLTFSGISGAFGVGEVLEGDTSGAKGIIRAVTVDTIDLNELIGVFQVGETISSSGPPVGSATLDAIDRREGAISATDGGGGGDPVRNYVSVVDTYTGRKPVDTDGNPIFGRLLFGPDGASGPGGGDPGELLVGTGIIEQINFVQGSPTVTNNNINFTNYFLPGDLIEGADGRFYEIDSAAGSVTSTALTLVASKPYLGPNASAGNGAGSGIGPRRRRRFLVKLVSLSSGTETEQTVTPGSTIPSGAGLRFFFPTWLEGGQSAYDALLDLQAPGDAFGLAQTSVPGTAYNAPGTGGGSGTGVPVVGAIRTIQNNGATVGDGNFHTINFTAGAINSPSPGVLNITAAGPPGAAGPGGTATPGPPGPTGLGYTQILAYQTQEVTISSFGITTGALVFSFGAAYRFFMVNSALKLASSELDTGFITGVTATSGSSSLTVSYQLDGGLGGLGQIVVFGAAAAG